MTNRTSNKNSKPSCILKFILSILSHCVICAVIINAYKDIRICGEQISSENSKSNASLHVNPQSSDYSPISKLPTDTALLSDVPHSLQKQTFQKPTERHSRDTEQRKILKPHGSNSSKRTRFTQQHDNYELRHKRRRHSNFNRRHRRKRRKKNPSKSKLRFLGYYPGRKDMPASNSYTHRKYINLQNRENKRPSQIFNTRTRKSFRSRIKNSNVEYGNNILNSRDKDLAYRNGEERYTSSKNYDNQKTSWQSKLADQPRNPHKHETKRPNIILMMADDQDVELGSLQFMPKLNRYLRGEGAHLKSGYATTPMCCPSRSSILTGLYAHNHNVLTNNDNCSSTSWVKQHEPRTFATYIQKSGYKTGYFGKYLNKYAGNHIPAGWDEWSGLIRNSRFYNYSVNVNGIKIRHGSNYERDYYPDLITNDSLAFFRQTKQRNPDQPVLMVMSYPGPHGPEDAAPQYSDLFFNVTTHHNPSYDYAPNPDKQWILQVVDRMEPIHKKFTDVLMTKRLQTLQSIDESIERLHHELELLGELDNTYIFYTSDHGYHLGQFGLVKGKGYPFDVDTKVPFFVRGPNIDGGTVYPRPVLNIDLAPTFLDIAGVEVPSHMDGKSILPVVLTDKKLNDEQLKIKSGWRDSFLIERGKMTTDRYQKIRNAMPLTTNNPWDKLHNIIPLPEGPATLFHEDRMNNTVDFATNDFDLEGKYSLNRNNHIVIIATGARVRLFIVLQYNRI